MYLPSSQVPHTFLCFEGLRCKPFPRQHIWHQRHSCLVPEPRIPSTFFFWPQDDGNVCVSRTVLECVVRSMVSISKMESGLQNLDLLSQIGSNRMCETHSLDIIVCQALERAGRCWSWAHSLSLARWGCSMRATLQAKKLVSKTKTLCTKIGWVKHHHAIWDAPFLVMTWTNRSVIC